jgi:hypothetical protein
MGLISGRGQFVSDEIPFRAARLVVRGYLDGDER